MVCRSKGLIFITWVSMVMALSGIVQGQPQEGGMSGIVFFKTQKLEGLTDFYVNRVGCTLWLDQADCRIFRFGNLLFGFCQRDQAEPGGLITFFYERKEAVDRAYGKFESIALSPPKMNEKYRIYHFFARDPEGRMVEFQHFADPIDWDFDT